MPYSRLKTETRIAQSSFASRTLSDADSANSRAALLAAMNRPVEARALVADARKASDAAGGYEVEALLADREDNDAALKAALAKAEQLGTTNYYALFRLAVLELPQNPDAAAAAAAEARLRKAVELNAFHHRSHAMLAQVLANGPVEKRAQAVPAAQTAVKLAPRDSFTNMALAMAWWGVGQRDAAIARARAAVTVADSDATRRQTQQMLDFFLKNATAPR
jgi:hypothetical protein